MFSLSNVLHVVGQALLKPCMAILIIFMIVTLWQIGSVIVEFFTERRKMKVDMPALLKKIHEVGADHIDSLIEGSHLLNNQKKVVLALLDTKIMPNASRIALAQELITSLEDYYERVTAITDLIIKLGPMFGLLGTLIPLGPGIVALGQGDTVILSQSLAIAFDTTIMGIATAGVCYIISNIRKRWYEQYIMSIESLMDCVIEEVVIDD